MHKFRFASHLLAVLAAAAVLPGAAWAASDIALSFEGSLQVPLLPLGQRDVVMVIHNNGPDAVASLKLGRRGAAHPEYVLSMAAQQGCGVLLPGFDDAASEPGQHFDVSALSVGEIRRCRLTVQRVASGSFPINFEWESDGIADPIASNNQASFQVGSFTDLAMSAEPVSFRIDESGFGRAIVRLRASNLGQIPVGSMTAGACPPFSAPNITGAIAGGCQAGGALLCFSVGDGGFAFQLNQIAAGQSQSCLVELRTDQPYTQPVEYPVSGVEPRTADNFYMFDTNESNDTAMMRIGPVTSVGPAQAVAIDTLSPFAVLLLLVAVLVLASLRHRP